MYKVLKLLIVCMVPISVFGMVTFLMYHDIKGWGWLLVVALLLFGTASVSIK